jgi:hypothetical protein
VLTSFAISTLHSNKQQPNKKCAASKHTTSETTKGGTNWSTIAGVIAVVIILINIAGAMWVAKSREIAEENKDRLLSIQASFKSQIWLFFFGLLRSQNLSTPGGHLSSTGGMLLAMVVVTANVD